MSKWAKFLQITQQLAPIALSFTPLAPIAGAVANGIAQAQLIEGATGPEKLAHVTAIAIEAANATNAQAGHVIIDPALVQATAAEAISTTVSAIKLVNDAKTATAPSQS